MRFVCRTCGAAREAEDVLVRQASEIVCGQCGSAMTPDRGAQVARAQRPRSAVPIIGLTEQWFVRTQEGGRGGPYSAAQLARLLEQGVLGWKSQIWREGLKDWRPARRDDVLVTAVASARGMASDTSRVDMIGHLLESGDTYLDRDPSDALSSVTPTAIDAPSVRESPHAGFEHAAPHEAASPHARPALPREPPRVRHWPVGQPRWHAPTQRRAGGRLPSLARYRTFFIAALAFVAGALLTQTSKRVLMTAEQPPPSRVELALMPGAERTSSAPPRPWLSTEPASLAEQEREAVEAVRAELARRTPRVRRCLRRTRELRLELAFDGASGALQSLDVRAPSLRTGRRLCVLRALEDLTVAPSALPELRFEHRYAW